jgi:hypothetical protein
VRPRHQDRSAARRPVTGSSSGPEPRQFRSSRPAEGSRRNPLLSAAPRFAPTLSAHRSCFPLWCYPRPRHLEEGCPMSIPLVSSLPELPRRKLRLRPHHCSVPRPSLAAPLPLLVGASVARATIYDEADARDRTGDLPLPCAIGPCSSSTRTVSGRQTAPTTSLTARRVLTPW